jgi:hypothetical protein
VCCKEENSSTPVATGEVSCEGNCYDATSCSAIGKTNGFGCCGTGVLGCYNTDLICCTETVDSSGKKVIGAACGDDSECASGHCWDATSMYGVSWQGQALSGGKICQQESLNEANAALAQADLKAGLFGLQLILSFTPAGPVLQIISATTQGVQAVYTCSELAQIKNNPDIDQATKDQFSKACAASSISAVTGLIGGGASAVNTFATGLSTGAQLTVSGIGMVDNLGNLVVSGMNVNTICEIYGKDSLECYTAKANAAVAAGSTAVGVYQFGNNYNTYVNQQIADIFDGLDSLGYGYQSVSVDDIKPSTLPDELLNKIDVLPKSKSTFSNFPTTVSKDEVVRVYRGIWGSEGLDELQTAKLFRYQDLSPDQIDEALDYAHNLGVDFELLGSQHKGLNSTSPYLGVTTDPNIAKTWAGSTGRVIVADIPTTELYDLEKMYQAVNGQPSQFADEIELGIFGYLNPDYIVDVIQYP